MGEVTRPLSRIEKAVEAEIRRLEALTGWNRRSPSPTDERVECRFCGKTGAEMTDAFNFHVECLVDVYNKATAIQSAFDKPSREKEKRGEE